MIKLQTDVHPALSLSLHSTHFKFSGNVQPVLSFCLDTLILTFIPIRSLLSDPGPYIKYLRTDTPVIFVANSPKIYFLPDTCIKVLIRSVFKGGAHLFLVFISFPV